MVFVRDSFAFATVALLVLAPQARQPVTPGTGQQRALEALEQRWLGVEDDPSALESILADDFIHVLPSGFVTKREQLDFMRAHPAPNDGIVRRFEDLRVRVYGTAAVATGIVAAAAPDGTVHRTRFSDVFA